MSRFIVNDQPVQYRLPDDTPLLWALRDASNLTGTKYGCGNGDCGACTVIVDGEAAKACLLSLGEMEGRSVTTIEALSPDRSHPVQQAFVAEQAIQCGFCTPGMVMAAAALLAQNADPSEDQIKAALTNMCRCGVYPRLVRAVQRAGRAMRGEDTIPPVPAPGIRPAEAARTVPALGSEQGDTK
ncbi:(2Fe-2S)-binding protein [Novosphingobium sp. ZN18A2]|uniref:(2Fe-2S)-binding protein n=1 Tax=Novosphingobium sp. ZN18A2 TaxID=3079861 RepID=UPI0030D4D1D6